MTEYKTIERQKGDKVFEFFVCPKHGPWLFLVHRPEGSVVVGKHYCPECAKERLEMAAWGRSGIPQRFKAKTFANYTTPLSEQKKALAACRASYPFAGRQPS